MGFSGFVLNIVGCALIETIAGIIMPEGRMKKFTISILALFLFFSIVYPLVTFVYNGGLDELVYNLF